MSVADRVGASEEAYTLGGHQKPTASNQNNQHKEPLNGILAGSKSNAAGGGEGEGIFQIPGPPFISMHPHAPARKI